MNPIATDHFTDADGTHIVDGHPAPCCGGYDEKPGTRGKWVPLDALVIERDADGEWEVTESAVTAFMRFEGKGPHRDTHRILMRKVLDALEAAGGETPE